MRGPGRRLPRSGWTPIRESIEQGQTWALRLVVVALLANAVATAYGFRQLRHLSDLIRWEVIPGVIYAPRESPSEPGRAGVTVEFWSDYTCPQCVASVPAIERLRRRFEREPVQWVYRFLPRWSPSDHSAFRLAALGYCTDNPWGLLNEVAEKGAGAPLARATPSPTLFPGCLESDSVRSHLWQSRLEAARRGISGTPTIFVNGIRLQGRTDSVVLGDLISQQLLERTTR